MSLSPEQDSAAMKIVHWLPSSDQVFMLGGFAGTGKTYLLSHIIQDLKTHNNLDILCCAPTGKAASVLRSKLNGKDVTTIHSLIYSPISEDTKRLEALLESLSKDPTSTTLLNEIDIEKRRLADLRVGFQITSKAKIVPDQLVIVDESSMVSNEMYRDLVATGAKLLFVGDPGQLPPVGDGGWFLKADYDVVLREVQRQALESPIIRLSMDVRGGTVSTKNYQYDDCRISDKSEVSKSDWMKADQVITGTNASRRKINRFYRKQLGHVEKSDLPIAGEKLICLKNNSETDIKYINGVQAMIASDSKYDDFGNFRMDVMYEGSLIESLECYDFYFLEHYQDNGVIDPWYMRKDLREFDYAYAITVHKSQGSEWDTVIIADDKMMRENFNFRKRWLYTAVTRAKTNLIWST